jgi:hypothetical protein
MNGQIRANEKHFKGMDADHTDVSKHLMVLIAITCMFIFNNYLTKETENAYQQ